MSTFYSTYIQHCMRFYTRYPFPDFHTETDRTNWLACDVALEELNQTEKRIILDVYKESSSISENVLKIAERENMSTNSVWKIINDFEHKVANARGLI